MAYISKITPLGSSESYDLKAARLTDITSTDAASSTSTGRYVWFSYI